MGGRLAVAMGMTEVVLTVRIPIEARGRLRAICAVTGLPLGTALETALTKFYDQLPLPIREEVKRIAQLYVRDHGGKVKPGRRHGSQQPRRTVPGPTR